MDDRGSRTRKSSARKPAGSATAASSRKAAGASGGPKAAGASGAKRAAAPASAKAAPPPLERADPQITPAMAEDHFTRGILTRGEAARSDDGELPPDVTHEIVEQDAEGRPTKIERKRYSAF